MVASQIESNHACKAIVVAFAGFLFPSGGCQWQIQVLRSFNDDGMVGSAFRLFRLLFVLIPGMFMFMATG